VIDTGVDIDYNLENHANVNITAMTIQSGTKQFATSSHETHAKRESSVFHEKQASCENCKAESFVVVDRGSESLVVMRAFEVSSRTFRR